MKKKLFTLVCGSIGTNCYILINEYYDAIIFDIPDSAGKEIANFCKKNKFNPLAILLTHGHFDHCGGVAEFLKYFSVPVYGNSDDYDLAMSASNNKFRIHAQDCEIKNFIADGDCIEIKNFKIDVMHTPGHTPGSVCYFVDDLMFSGDTLFLNAIGRTDFQESDPQKMSESLCKIKNLKQDYIVLPGHEESTTLFNEKHNNRYLN